ncbi:MAG: phosphatase, partial [Planctomycetia bacterium]|nr:phosphatase [Planctomycetia bacterium]
RSDNPFVNFYWDYFAQGKTCYAPMNFPDLAQTIQVIHSCGGKAVLAHPGNNLKNRFELLDEIVPLGLDGIEVFCSYHDRNTIEYFLRKAKEYSLLFTCGSDYHGKTKPAVRLGVHGCFISQDEIESQLVHAGLLNGLW